jgi:hypothetical protein
MTNLITLQTIFIKDDVSIRLNKLDNHLKQIQCLLLDSNNNDVVKSLIRETMYFIEWIAPDIEFNYAFELANSEVWNNIEARNQIIDELGTWNDRVLQMSQLLAAHIMTQPPLPQPQLEPSGITFDQYEEFTPAKLELSNGYLGYGGQDNLGFHLSVLTNMGLLTAVRNTNLSLWIKALDCVFREKLAKVNAEPEVAEAMLNRFNQAMLDLEAVIDYLGE